MLRDVRTKGGKFRRELPPQTWAERSTNEGSRGIASYLDHSDEIKRQRLLQVESAKHADVLYLAGRYTTLRRESSQEWAGPCPKCGGDDRFHCTSEWWFCRTCHADHGDSIDFVRWLTGADFREAVAMLTGIPMPTVPNVTALQQRYGQPIKQASTKRTPPDVQARLLAQWQADAESETQAAEQALSGDAGATGRAYLESRGLLPDTWRIFRFGFCSGVPLPGTGGAQCRPAILMPWTVGGVVAAIRYRFIEKHTYADRDGRERKDVKQTAKPKAFDEHDLFAGRMFGGLGLAGPVGGKWDLVICEGEINAVSICQVAQAGRVDVLSVGSQSSKITDAMLKRIVEYRRVIVWMDETDKLDALRERIPGATGIASPHRMDANDCLQKGTLQAMISELRRRACKDDTEREALLWDLWDQHNLYGGVDEPTQALIDELRRSLGK